MPHLLKVHPDGVIKHVRLSGTGIFLRRFLLLLLVLFDFGAIENLDLEVVEYGDYVLKLLGLTGNLRQSFVNVLVSQETLFTRMMDKGSHLVRYCVVEGLGGLFKGFG